MATRRAMAAALYPRRQSTSPNRRLLQANAREVSKAEPPLPPGETSEADTLPHSAELPTAALRIPRCGPRETADKSARESPLPAKFPRRKQKTTAMSGASAPHLPPQARPA